MANGPAAAIEMEFGARAGARTVLSACASSHRVARRGLPSTSQTGDADIVIAGGAEAALHPLPLAVVRRDAGPVAAATTPPRPPRVRTTSRATASCSATAPRRSSSRPKEHAEARGATIYAEVAGAGITSRRVPHHRARTPRAAPPPVPSCGARARRRRASRTSCTSTRTRPRTPVGDIAEYHAMRRVFGDHLDDVVVSATKASTGHLLGGAGAIEAVFTVLALHNRVAPPTINLTEQDPEIVMDVATRAARAARGRPARGQQLVRLRRPQRRRRVPQRLIRHTLCQEARPASSGRASVVPVAGSQSRQHAVVSLRRPGNDETPPCSAASRSSAVSGRHTGVLRTRRRRPAHPRRRRVASRVSRRGAARRRGCPRPRGGRARARRPRPARGRVGAHGAVRGRCCPRPPWRSGPGPRG